MRTVKIFETGETVLIKAVVSKVTLDKDRISYTLKDAISGTVYQNRFSEKDIIPFEGQEESEEEVNGALGV